jgi:hypothetical protein
MEMSGQLVGKTVDGRRTLRRTARHPLKPGRLFYGGESAKCGKGSNPGLQYASQILRIRVCPLGNPSLRKSLMNEFREISSTARLSTVYIIIQGQYAKV